ncbi:hypothetical protein PMNALOAF_3422 [Methylobacterium adhaesivum]|uniref:Uncharacterized protein n=1 Tax=Methylobacterium adhaesivum TaxID=333297 RepID=A0ABT8BK06_9HYPH|nr:hypothetical protein [Methylobacterium adhaesivum]MDN3591817.1 hypothetical protein [Methylobacterium adhaesivum]GJD32155.1 hypothetical protein PMNALOAF_3422 [Methylobacterium adhaesivum]
MRIQRFGLALAILILAPAAASAQYYGGDFDRRGGDVHVDRYRHGDHDDIVIHRRHRVYGDRAYYRERRFYDERRHHHYHHDDY